MAIQFCASCGTLLDESSLEDLKCDSCGTVSKNYIQTQTQTTTSKPSQFPSKLRNKLQLHTQAITQGTAKGPTVEMQCAKCPAREIAYQQVQMRSADEGSAVFYTCLGCGRRWQEGN